MQHIVNQVVQKNYKLFMRSYQMYHGAAATTTSAAVVTIAKKCRLKAVSWQVVAESLTGAADTYFQQELSVSSAPSDTVNDAQGVLSRQGFSGSIQQVTAAGYVLLPFVTDKHEVGLDYPLEAGQKVYIHVGNEANVASQSTYCILHCSE